MSAASTSTTNNRVSVDPDADAPVVPKKRNWPQLIGVTDTDRDGEPRGAQLLNGPRIDHQAFEALSCTAQLLRLVLDEDGAIRSYEMMPAIGHRRPVRGDRGA